MKFSDSNYNILETYFNILKNPRSGDANSYLVSQKGVIIAVGGVYTPLYQLKDNGDFVGYKFIISRIEGDNFIFTYEGILSEHSEATELELGKEMYFRKDAFFRDWLNNNTSEYGNFINKNKSFIYFGKIYEVSRSIGEYYIQFEGLKNWVMKCLPQHNRTDRLTSFMDVAFDHVYHETYNMMKNMWSFFDAKEISIDHLYYLADRFNIQIDKDLNETILREWVDQLNYVLKRKGTYTAYYIIFKLLFSNTKNKLNIYERWLEHCHKRIYGDATPINFFREHHILEKYGIHPSGGSGIEWYQDYMPSKYPSASSLPPWQRGIDCSDPSWQCGDLTDLTAFYGEDSGSVLQLFENDLISIESFNPATEIIRLNDGVNIPSYAAGGFRHCFDFYVPASGSPGSGATSPSGSICIWAISDQNDMDFALQSNEVGFFVDILPTGIGTSLRKNNEVGDYLSGTLQYDKPYFITVYSYENLGSYYIRAEVFDDGRRIESSKIDTLQVVYDGMGRDYLYVLNHLKQISQGSTANINIDIGSYKLSSAFVDTIGPTGNLFLTPHYKVEVDLSKEPMNDGAIINKYHATELIRYWEYMKPVSKYVDYHFVIAPIAKIDNFSENISLYDPSLQAYCDSRFTGSFFLSASTSAAQVYGEDFAIKSFVFRQPTSKEEWKINHFLGTEDVIVQVYDEYENITYMDNIVIHDENSLTLYFESSARGSAYIAGLKTWNYLHTEVISSGTWTITHNMGSSGASGFGFDIYNLNRSEYLIPDRVKEISKDVMEVRWSTSGAPASVAGRIPIRDEDYIFYQNTPSTVWTINHNLDSAGFVVEVWDGDEYVYPESIIQETVNRTKITFSEPVSGYAAFVYFQREFSATSVFESLFDNGYWMIGDQDIELWNPEAAGSLYSPTASGSINVNNLIEYDDKYILDFSIPVGDEYTIKEIGLFDKNGNIMFYTRCSELFKPSNVQLDVHYRMFKE